MRARRTQQPICTIPDHVPGSVHGPQIHRANQTIDRLRAEIDALKAMLDWAPAKETTETLLSLAAAFRTGEQAGWPGGKAQSLDDKVATSKPESREPQDGDRDARRAVYVLQRRVEEAVDSFHARQENDWKSPWDKREAS